MANGLQKAALAYARKGKAIFPLNGKVPRTINGHKDASTDARAIREWWENAPKANIGMPTGKVNGIVALDVDPRNGGTESFYRLNEDHGRIPDTLKQKTGGGGFHFIFEYPQGVSIKNGRIEGYPGLDVKAEGGYIVVPPSRTTGTYKWENKQKVEPLPEWLLKLTTGAQRKLAEAIPEIIPNGKRNTTLTSLAGSMRRRGASPQAIFKALQEENKRCADPLHDKELQGIAKSIARYEPEISRENSIHLYHLTDLGNAKRLADRHGHDLRFVPEIGWLFWDGKRWKKDGSREVERKMQETVASIYTEASNAPDTDTRKRLAKHATSSESLNKMRAAIGVAESLLTADIQDFDTDPLLFNVVNGVIDLRTGELRDHNRDDLISQLAPVDYDPDAAAPQFTKFLKRIFNGNQNLISFIQRAFGYGLTGLTDEHCFFIGWGGGANGKTTLFRTYLKALGDYAKVTSAETLLIKRQQAINNDIARLRGARVVIASEAEEGRRLAESLVKELTGADRVQARFLYHEAFEFVPTFKLFLATNHKPVVKGTDLAIWRRIRLIPFSVTIPPEEQDRKLMDKLEEELPGVLAWAVQGCLEWQQVGLRPPDEVRKATGAYRQDMDVLGSFLSDCCETSTAFHDSAKELYRKYGEWADENGERKITQKRFGQYLTERGFESRRITSGADKGKREWVGIGLQG